MDRYIVVHGVNGPSARPRVHRELASAQLEADRIARLSPGVKVYVLQAVGYCQHKESEWVSESYHDDLRFQDMPDVMRISLGYTNCDEPDF